MSDGYRRNRVWYGDNGGSLTVTPFTTTTTLVTHKAKSAIYVQFIRIQITGALAATTWSLQDSLTGVSLTGAISAAVAPVNTVIDLGPAGIPLSNLADLTFVPSAPGATGIISWDAYQRTIDASLP